MNGLDYNRGKRHQIHPILDPLLTDSYHLQYSGLFLLYTQNHFLKSTLKNILTMNNPLTANLVSNAEDNSRSSIDLIRHQFIMNCGIDKSAQTENLLQILKKSLGEAGYSQEKISETLSEFTDKNLTVGGYLKSWEHGPLVKAMGFPSFQTYQAYQRENLSSPDKRKQRLELKLSTRHLLANLKASDQLCNDTPRENFLKTIRAYVKKVELKEVNHNVIKMAGQEALETLNVIQNNTLFIARAYLASEERLQTLSLRQYNAQETPAKMYFSHKELSKVNKIINSSNNGIDLIKNTESIPLCFNCYLCPSSAGVVNENDDTDDADDKTNRPKIIDKTRSQFNVFRLLPLQTSDDIRAHIQKFHSVAGAVALARSEPHSKLYICKECPPENLDYAVSCCQLHHEDHMRLCHSDKKIHFRLLRAFRNACKVKEKIDALWSRTNKDRDISTGPLTRLFARLLAPLTHSLIPDCSLRSRTLYLRSFVRSLTHFCR